jgi:hypothetical protein
MYALKNLSSDSERKKGRKFIMKKSLLQRIYHIVTNYGNLIGDDHLRFYHLNNTSEIL